jgi:hypothetical protein
VKYLTFLGLTFLLFVGCQKKQGKLSIKGSWYFDLGEWSPIDSGVDYTELYFTDSSYYAQDEAFGQSRDLKYLLTNDSLYFEGMDPDSLNPFYKIISFNNDTLWLKANPKYLKNRDTLFLVKFPKGEVGRYDLRWTTDNRDSLNHKVIIDYERRMWKYHAFKYGDMEKFDSMERVGNWRWTMKDVNEGARREKDYLEKNNPN